MSQSANAGHSSTIVQAGRDAILGIPKSPPNIRLVRLEIDDDQTHGTLRQKLNVILKNNGDYSAFLLRGSLICSGSATIRLCNQIGMQFSLSKADWTYDVDIDSVDPSFVGHHSIEPNEVVNFNVMVARESGGHEPTVYRAHLKFDFDEGDSLETDDFHLMISGPVVWQGGFQANGPSPDEWGNCQAENVRRLREIGFDYRDHIHPESRKYVEAVAPGIFDDE
ncbi:hypothetical protein PUV47_00095 [Pseudovibrio exalbescens]|uniref:hypothetical protein n=1 Tax=Pseudovibrio exalbescens TaxID=197461 RepID=UPI002366DC76|nr:hypothetical protein [Pseudovibrio exalbescens]MDD7908306.1 hypothetical protein [Pseudovibrio exalbescens]